MRHQMYVASYSIHFAEYDHYSFLSSVSVKNRIKYRNKCVLLAQKIIRGFLARKQHQPRFRGIMKIKALSANLQKTAEIAHQLRGSKEVMLRQVAEVEQLIRNSVQKIKVSEFRLYIHCVSHWLRLFSV